MSEFSTASPALVYRGVYPGIDLKLYHGAAGPEYDWIVAPHADPAAIRVTSARANPRISPEGDLIAGGVRHTRPVAYQMVDGRKRLIPAAFDMMPDGRVGFRIGDYDSGVPLVIDPALSLVSGVGGSGYVNPMLHPTLFTDYGSSIALDAAGNIYLAGLTYSSDFPLINAAPGAKNCTSIACACPSPFVTKLSPDGSSILYSTLIAGCTTAPPAMAVDSAGNAYIATGTAVQPAFVEKLDTTGALLAKVVIGGSGTDTPKSVVVGKDGRIYIAGTTTSADLPVTPGALGQALAGAQDLFLTALNPASLAPAYATYLGPGSAPALAVDGSGNAYVAASTTSTAWSATPGVFQPQCGVASNVCADVIALKVSADATRYLYTTYIGGSQTDTAAGVALDATGNLYIAGTTSSSDFPTTSGAYARNGAGPFVVKLSPDAGQLSYSTLLGSQAGAKAGSLALDSSGNAWLGGLAGQTALPVTQGIQQTLFNSRCGIYTPSGEIPQSLGYCPQAAFIAEINPAGGSLLWATYLGGGNVSESYPYDTLPSPSLTSMVFDAGGNLLVTGNQLALRNTAAGTSPTNSASVVRIAPSGNSLGYLAVESAAGYGAGLPLPGGLATLFVSGIPALSGVLAPALPWPTQLGGITVLVDGVPAPLVAAATSTTPFGPGLTQVNFQVPAQLFTSVPQSHIVEVRYGNQSAFAIPQQTGPDIFTLADGSGAIQHAADYSLVTVQNPVKRGEILIFYGTGFGNVGVGKCTVTTNAGTVLFAGLSIIPGLNQVNVQVSQSLPSGTNYFYLQAVGCWVDNLLSANSGPQGNSVGVYVP